MHQFKPQTLLPNLLAGLIVGLVTLIYSISCAALIFSGSLASFFAQGMVNALVGAIVVVVVVALRSPLPFTIAGPIPGQQFYLEQWQVRSLSNKQPITGWLSGYPRLTRKSSHYCMRQDRAFILSTFELSGLPSES
ncbi:MAG TPA: hypothetical protein V6C85_36795 [Allocoleopsis sp.]